MSNKKIGLCMTFQGSNYGQLLQSYALQQKIDDLGYETEIIQYRSGKDKGIKISYASVYVSVCTIANALRRKLLKNEKNRIEEYDTSHRENIYKRNDAADEFRKNRFHDVTEINGYTNLVKKSKDYSAVVVGSDQIWLPDVAVTNFYTLRFVVPEVTRISYATSMGVSSYPNYAKKPAADYWRKIDYLSVREEQAKNVIKEIAGVDAKVVADPTYLLTAEEWEERIPIEKVIEPNYILCYFLGNSQPMKKYARKFADKKGLRLVSILSNECNSDDNEFADEVLIGKSPEEFINLIRNSEYVLTDSFHGLAFSVINEKQFYIFYRNRTDVKQSRNSRIDNIVKTWGLENRLIKNSEKEQIDESVIDYSRVSDIRNRFREESLDFLRGALEKSKSRCNT